MASYTGTQTGIYVDTYVYNIFGLRYDCLLWASLNIIVWLLGFRAAGVESIKLALRLLVTD